MTLYRQRLIDRTFHLTDSMLISWSYFISVLKLIKMPLISLTSLPPSYWCLSLLFLMFWTGPCFLQLGLWSVLYYQRPLSTNQKWWDWPCHHIVFNPDAFSLLPSSMILWIYEGRYFIKNDNLWDNEGTSVGHREGAHQILSSCFCHFNFSSRVKSWVNFGQIIFASIWNSKLRLKMAPLNFTTKESYLILETCNFNFLWVNSWQTLPWHDSAPIGKKEGANHAAFKGLSDFSH